VGTNELIADLSSPHGREPSPSVRRLRPPILAPIFMDCRDTEAQFSMKGLSPNDALLMNMDDLAKRKQSPLQRFDSDVEKSSHSGLFNLEQRR
jgi:hypothetical protein